MVDTVNECLLNQTDFDFLTKAHIVTELTEKASSAEVGLSFNIFFFILLCMGALLITVLAVMVRERAKTASNLLLVTVVFSIFVLSFMTYLDFNKVKDINTKISTLNKELAVMNKPDTDVFYACNKAGSILKLAPDRDDPNFKSTYSQVISVDQ